MCHACMHERCGSLLRRASSCIPCRLWYRAREWQAEHVQVVGDEPIPGKFCLDRVTYGGRRLPLFPSDHFALYARFRRA